MRYLTYDYKDPMRPMFWVPEAQSVQYGETAYDGGDNLVALPYNIVVWAPGNPPGIEKRVRKASTKSIRISSCTGSTPTGEILSKTSSRKTCRDADQLFGVLGLVLAAIGSTA